MRTSGLSSLTELAAGGGDGQDARVIAVLPCTNQDRLIGSLLFKLRHYVDTIVVINDGSSDETGMVARQAGAEVIEFLTRQGQAVALQHGLARALDLDADVIVILEGEGQLIPDQVPLVIEPILQGGADMVLGVPLQESRRSVVTRRLKSRLGRGVAAQADGGKLRAFTRGALAACGLYPAGVSVDSPQPVPGAQSLRALEVPISPPEGSRPTRGRFLLRPDVILRLFGVTGPLRLLLVFALIGIALTFTGIYFWYQTVEIFAARNELALGHALLGTLAITVGVMVVFEALTLQVLRSLVETGRRRGPNG